MTADDYEALRPRRGVHGADTSRMAQRPSDMRAVEKVTGLTFGEVMGAGTADTFQAIALIELRKRDRAAGRGTARRPRAVVELPGRRRARRW